MSDSAKNAFFRCFAQPHSRFGRIVNLRPGREEDAILHISYTDHFVIRIELRYLIGKNRFFLPWWCEPVAAKPAKTTVTTVSNNLRDRARARQESRDDVLATLGRSLRSRPLYWKTMPRPREPPSYGQEKRKARRDLAPGRGGRTDLERTMEE